MSEFYVYALIDPRDNQIFYLGKGKGDRHLHHIKEIKELDKKQYERKVGINPNKISRIKDIIESGLELKYEFIANNLSEDAAYVLEEILVERFGREILKNGKLLNLEPGGKWEYPKIILNEKEKTTIADLKTKFPELLPIIEKYPHVATESKLLPWWVLKIPKRFALFQFSTEGTFIATHNTTYFMQCTGMSSNIITKCIESNCGFAYGYLWAFDKNDNFESFLSASFEKLNAIKSYKNWEIKEISNLEYATNYQIRNQEIDEEK